MVGDLTKAALVHCWNCWRNHSFTPPPHTPGTCPPPLPHCRDTAGQERYESLAPLYYRGANAAIVVFDLTSAPSFTRAAHWVGELRRNAANTAAAAAASSAAQQQQHPGVILVLVGNKADLAGAAAGTTAGAGRRAVSREEAQELADR